MRTAPSEAPLLLTVLALGTVGCGASAKQDRPSAYAGRILIEKQHNADGVITIVRPGRGCHRIARLPPYSYNSIAPNGRSVAYVAGTRKRILIRVLRLGDGRPRTISRTTAAPGSPWTSPADNLSWSADSRSIVYAAGASIVIARADGGGRRLLTPVTHKGALYATPKLSPDGRSIAFWAVWGNARAGTLATELNVISTADLRVRTLYVDPRPTGREEFAWAPAGETLAYTVTPSATASRDDLYSIRADGTGRRKLAHLNGTSQESGSILWAPNGKSLALSITLTRHMCGGVRFALTCSDVYIVSADGSDSRRLTVSRAKPGGGSRTLAWSPRGGRLLLQRGQDFLTLRRDRTDERRVCSLKTNESYPSYAGGAVWAP